MSSSIGYEEYDSEEPLVKFLLCEKEKDECLKTLHCSKKRSSDQTDTFKTRTSHWVRGTNCRRAAYQLLKVKRWHLKDENLLFDPLSKCPITVTLKQEDTLWPNFDADEKKESIWTVGCMLRLLTKDQLDVLKKLEEAMEPLDENVDVRTGFLRNLFATQLMKNTPDVPECARQPFRSFILNIAHAMFLHVNGKKLRETVFEETFLKFVECVAVCVGSGNEPALCSRNVLGTSPEDMIINMKKDAKLGVAGCPDLYLYVATPEYDIRMISVTEVKGLVNDDLLSSGDEDECEDTPCQHVAKGREDGGAVSLDEDGDSDDDVEILKYLVKEPPDWLEKISSLPYRAQKALKKFLPQLIGEMMCCARSKDFRPIDSDNGLLLGIGVAGFDIYFVSMLDSCRSSRKSVVNNDSACTQVFVTRPFNLRKRHDRQKILKVIAASLQLWRKEALVHTC